MRLIRSRWKCLTSRSLNRLRTLNKCFIEFTFIRTDGDIRLFPLYLNFLFWCGTRKNDAFLKVERNFWPNSNFIIDLDFTFNLNWDLSIFLCITHKMEKNVYIGNGDFCSIKAKLGNNINSLIYDKCSLIFQILIKMEILVQHRIFVKLKMNFSCNYVYRILIKK